ncbi:hypothetical protein [Paractinoplanes maris]|uniref:hypothetical protein n=1 Tax=Paractinoplanes maris TaxID=1734446 RepID=UPI00202116AF|nr:hypothetical protein [Actinoplanes maris]
MSIDAITERPAPRAATASRVVIAVAVALVAAAGVAVWLWPRADDPRTRSTEAALRQALAIGGPRGWSSADPVALLPQDGQTGTPEIRGGVRLGVVHDGRAETGFVATWTTASAGTAACDALAEWAVRTVQHSSPDEVRAGCRDAGNGLFASHGTTPGPGGRQMFYASADGDILTVSLAYESALN